MEHLWTAHAPWSRHIVGAVAVGGAIGATLRWAVGATFEHDPGGWPWSTLIVNLVGCLGIGIAARRLVYGGIGWAFVVTGMLGGFTTFSAFAIELNDLAEARRSGVAVLYAAITLAGGIGATALASGPVPAGEP